jgi:hypothetical protein
MLSWHWIFPIFTKPEVKLSTKTMQEGEFDAK